MKRTVSLLTALLIMVVGSRPVQASTPVISAQVFGIELCPQFFCGAAIFTGVLAGQVDNNPPAFGTFIVAITHETPLPQETNEQVNLTGGVFEIRIGLRRFRGEVSSGTLTKNVDNSFIVLAVLTITKGGSGDMTFLGTLDHTVFPPTISGFIFQ